MDKWLSTRQITHRNVDATIRHLYRTAEQAYVRSRTQSPVGPAGWSVMDARAGGRLHVPEAVRAWVLGQIGELFAAWVLSGSEPSAERLARHATLAEWACATGYRRVIDPQDTTRTRWIQFDAHATETVSGLLTTTLFGLSAEALGQDPQLQPSGDVGRLGRALLDLAGVLTPQQVWEGIGPEGHMRALKSQDALRRLTANRFMAMHFNLWRGKIVRDEEGVAVVHRMRAAVVLASAPELEALNHFGLDGMIDVDDAAWIQLHDLIAREQVRRLAKVAVATVRLN